MRERVLACALVVPFVLGTTAAPADDGKVEFEFRDPEIVESSGLVVSEGLFLTTNDSGDAGRVFGVDPATGRTVSVTRWSEDPIDVEALAPAGAGRREVWVGDIGDNSAVRDSVRVTRVPIGRSDLTETGAGFDLAYPQGPEDAEALLSNPVTGQLFIATKNVFGGTFLEVPDPLVTDRPNRLRLLGDILPLATDGAFFPDGKHLILRDYSRAVVYTFPGLEEVGSFPLPAQQQGEGIAVDTEGAVFVSSEGQFSSVLRVALPADIQRVLDPATSTPSASTGGLSSTEATDAHEPTSDERPLWPWFLTGVIGAAAIVVLMRSLRRR